MKAEREKFAPSYKASNWQSQCLHFYLALNSIML